MRWIGHREKLSADYLISTIKILPHHFMQNNQGGTDKSIQYDDSGTIGVVASHADAELYAFIDIPAGKIVSSVTIHGSDTSNLVELFSASVGASGLTQIDGGEGLGRVGAEMAVASPEDLDWTSSSLNYLVIKVTVTAVSDIVYGGQVFLGV